MNTIQLRLSNKSDKNTGKTEILFRVSVRVSKSVTTLRAKSGIFINPKHFQYYIDRKSCEKYKVKVPVRMITCTKDEAEKKGYYIFDKGEVIINEKVITPEVSEDKMSADRLKDLLRVVTEYINNEGTEKTSDGLKDVIELFHNPDKYTDKDETEKDKNIYQVMEDYLQKRNFPSDGERGFRVLIRTVWRYEYFRRQTDDKSFVFDADAVTRTDIEDFEDYMRNEYNLSNEYPELFKKMLSNYPDYIVLTDHKLSIHEKGDNSIIKLMKKLKTFFTWLRDTERTTNRPFDGIKIGSEKYGTPYYITSEERNLIADYDLSGNKSLKTQRDIFVFHCLIGCRVGDLMKLTSDNIIDGILVYVPHKTKDEKSSTKVRVPLNPKALSLIKEYEGIDKKGRLFPFISSQKYNDAIKKVMKVCGITRNVPVRNPTTGETEIRPINEVASSHMARRTFIGATYKVVKDPNLIGKMSGHVEGSKAFVRYRDIDDDMLKDVISKI